MRRRIFLWYMRAFCKRVRLQNATTLGLKFIRNIYGDEIIWVNARSIWIDENGNFYYVEDLYK